MSERLDELPPSSCHETRELTSRAQKGQALQLFSSFPNSTADVHFRWMREYGLDGTERDAEERRGIDKKSQAKVLGVMAPSNFEHAREEL